MTEDEFLALDAASDRPNEFWFGRAFYRDGEGANHLSLAAMLITQLNNSFCHTPLHAAGSLLRVRMDEPRAYAYPDIVVWSDDARWSDEEHDTLLSPLLLAEIVTPATRQRDLVWKLNAYRHIPSLTSYFILWPDQVKVEHHFRTRNNDWLSRTLLRRDDRLFLVDMGITLPLRVIYDRLDVPEGTLDIELPFDEDGG